MSFTSLISQSSGIKYAAINVGSSGNNTLISAASGKRLIILACVLVSSGAVNVEFQDGVSGTPLSGAMNLTTNSGFTLPFSEGGWGETSQGVLLNLNLSSATAVDGMLVYCEIA